MIAYAFRQLKDFKKNYPTHDLELVVGMLALKIWRHYWYGVHCDTYIDYENFKYIFTQKGLNIKNLMVCCSHCIFLSGNRKRLRWTSCQGYRSHGKVMILMGDSGSNA